MAWQRKRNGLGSVGGAPEILREAAQGLHQQEVGGGGPPINFRNVHNRYKAALIGDGLSDHVWADVAARRKEFLAKKEGDGKADKSLNDYNGEYLLAAATIGNSTERRQELQNEFWDTVVKNKSNQVFPVKQGRAARLNAMAREIVFRSDQAVKEGREFALAGKKAPSGDETLKRLGQLAHLDVRIERAMAEPLSLGDLKDKDWDGEAGNADAVMMSKYPFLRSEHFVGDKSNPKTLGSNLSSPSFVFLQTWQQAKYDDKHPLNGPVRAILQSAYDADSALINNGKYQSDRAREAIKLVEDYLRSEFARKGK
jgi:hypothetical protein